MNCNQSDVEMKAHRKEGGLSNTGQDHIHHAPVENLSSAEIMEEKHTHSHSTSSLKSTSDDVFEDRAN